MLPSISEVELLKLYNLHKAYALKIYSILFNLSLLKIECYECKHPNCAF